jgi:hypothetical protein
MESPQHRREPPVLGVVDLSASESIPEDLLW